MTFGPLLFWRERKSYTKKGRIILGLGVFFLDLWYVVFILGFVFLTLYETLATVLIISGFLMMVFNKMEMNVMANEDGTIRDKWKKSRRTIPRKRKVR